MEIKKSTMAYYAGRVSNGSAFVVSKSDNFPLCKISKFIPDTLQTVSIEAFMELSI